jgi:hypothetical protein
MIIVNATTGENINLRALLRLFPRIGSTANPEQGIRTVWSDPPTSEQLATVGYQYLAETEAPTPGPGEQVVAAPHALIDGQWTRQLAVEAIPPPPVPDSLPRHVAQEVLLLQPHPEHGTQWDALIALVASMPEPQRRIYEARLNAPSIRRASSTLAAIAELLEWSAQWVDDRFRDGSALIDAV